MAGIPGPRRLTMGALPRPLQAHRLATSVMATRHRVQKCGASSRAIRAAWSGLPHGSG
jgi:hypothetical protein